MRKIPLRETCRTGNTTENKRYLLPMLPVPLSISHLPLGLPLIMYFNVRTVPVLSKVPLNETPSPFASFPSRRTFGPFTVTVSRGLSRQSEIRLASPTKRPLEFLLIFTVIVKGAMSELLDMKVPDHIPVRSGAGCCVGASTCRDKRTRARIPSRHRRARSIVSVVCVTSDSFSIR
jgi:hypothetical protein